MVTWYILLKKNCSVDWWHSQFSVYCVASWYLKKLNPLLQSPLKREDQIKSKVHTLKCHRVEAHISFHVFWIIWGSFQFSGRTRTWEFVLRSSNWFEFIPTLLFLFNRQYSNTDIQVQFVSFKWIKITSCMNG